MVSSCVPLSMKYKQREVLYEMYHERGMSLTEIGKEFDVHYTTIDYWINKHDIPKPSYTYRKKEVLQEMYHERGMSLKKIGEKFGVSHTAIKYQMEKHGIPRRTSRKYRNGCHVLEHGDGYEVFRVRDNDGGYHVVSIHRLLAVLKYGFEAVKDMDVHHKNGCKIDNRSENLELLTRAEHNKLHKGK